MFYDPVRNIDTRDIEYSLTSQHFATTGSTSVTYTNLSANPSLPPMTRGEPQEPKDAGYDPKEFERCVEKWKRVGTKLITLLDNAKRNDATYAMRSKEFMRKKKTLQDLLNACPCPGELAQEDAAKFLTRIISVTHDGNDHERPATSSIDINVLSKLIIRCDVYGDEASKQATDLKRNFKEAMKELSSLMEKCPALMTEVNALLAEERATKRIHTFMPTGSSSRAR